jgi:hypothetical protein
MMRSYRRATRAYRGCRYNGRVIVVPILAIALAHAPRPASPPANDAPSFKVAVSDRVEHVTYHFNNNSAFDTSQLVPHYFEQKYDAGAVWLTASAAYSALGTRMTTTGGLTPHVTTAASDIDTFFDPSGDVITSGTDGLAHLWSFAVDQRMDIVRAPSWSLGLDVGYRQSRADFLPADIVVTHTMPTSTSSTYTTDPETTFSRVFGVGVYLSGSRRLNQDWDVTYDASATPAASARLTTELPVTHPGQDITFAALAFGAVARAGVSHTWGRVAAGVELDAGLTRGYRQTADYRANTLAVAFFVRAIR